jgi:hypothetical protein
MGWTGELRPDFETPEAPSCECQAFKRCARPSDAAPSVTFEELRHNHSVVKDRIGKFGAEGAERYDLDLKAGGHNGEVDRRVRRQSLATAKPD